MSRALPTLTLLVLGCAIDTSGLGPGRMEEARDASGRLDAGDVDRPDAAVRDGGRVDAGSDAGLDTGRDGGRDAAVPMDACTPVAEICNGVDDDCDGMVDEGMFGPCGTGVGRCTPGELMCVDGAMQCVGGRGPEPELCNDQDDDCDAMTDEDNPEGGAVCGTSVGACRTGVMTCAGGALSCAGMIDPVPEICNGADDDCDGELDEAGCACTRQVYSGSVYLFCDSAVSWTTARSACPTGYHLAAIETRAENDFIESAADAISGSNWWIGLNDRGSEGNFVWDGIGTSPGYTRWGSGEPNDWFGEDCVGIQAWDGRWNDIDCGDSNRYVCETP